MATTSVLLTLDKPLPPRPRTTNSSLERQSTIFSSWKHKLSSRKGGDATSTAPGIKQSRHINSTAPPTRRPIQSHASNPSIDPNDAPPAYSAAPNAAPVTYVTPSAVSTGDVGDDPYAFLTSFDTIFLIDDSGSMAGSRWRETGEALETIAPICTAHDADGIDIFFLNRQDSAFHHNVKSSATVREVFQTVRPGGGTPTGQRLNQILKPYLRQYHANPDSTKPINIICITDGEPSDDVESPLIAAAKKLDKLDAPAWQIGVQFFQVGRDEEARKHLRQLDDDLAEISGDDDLRDIVDTVPFTGSEGERLTGEGILKVVLGAVNRRLDRKKSKDLHR